MRVLASVVAGILLGAVVSVVAVGLRLSPSDRLRQLEDLHAWTTDFISRWTSEAEMPRDGCAVRINAFNRHAYERGRAAALLDLRDGRLRLQAYGLRSFQLDGLDVRELARYGVEQDVVAGCIVSDELRAGVHGYNEVMTAEIERRHGAGILEAISRRVREDLQAGVSLAYAAVERTRHTVTYDGRYRAIDYPGGDVPDDIGVCTDVIVRAYRALDIDFQTLIHEDMLARFDAYPKLWGHTAPDPNIDHRRVPNMQVFLRRQGAELPISLDAEDYLPGDLVTWLLPGNLPHIGIVVGETSEDGRRNLIVHNIGAGPQLEDVLFAFPITGHYRYFAGIENQAGRDSNPGTGEHRPIRRRPAIARGS